MGVMEVVLIILGMIIFVGSFLIPAGRKRDSEDAVQLSRDTIREMVGREVDDAKNKISDIVDETIHYAIEKTERSMDRLTNEKMLAVNEYSDTVLEQINKNHKEVVFMYDMLNDKHENLKSTVSEAVKTASQVKQTVQESEPEFVPITPPHVEVIYQPETDSEPDPEPEVIEPEKKKTPRRSRASKNEKDINTKDINAKDINEKDIKEAFHEEMVVPDIEVTLNATGKTGGRNSNERILELHKAGKSNMAIAKQLGLGIGEVKLVIDLFEGI